MKFPAVKWMVVAHPVLLAQWKTTSIGVRAGAVASALESPSMAIFLASAEEDAAAGEEVGDDAEVEADEAGELPPQAAQVAANRVTTTTASTFELICDLRATCPLTSMSVRVPLDSTRARPACELRHTLSGAALRRPGRPPERSVPTARDDWSRAASVPD